MAFTGDKKKLKKIFTNPKNILISTFNFDISNKKHYSMQNQKRNIYTEMGPKRKQAVSTFDGMLFFFDLVNPYITCVKSNIDIISTSIFQDCDYHGEQNKLNKQNKPKELLFIICVESIIPPNSITQINCVILYYI